jgi:LmbE family N-acetylglucosaminyl deacetylase
LGIETQVLDIHDGELEPTLENRRTITRLIRDWKADIVFSHRPNDYHPDHRYTGILVQDAAYMVTVPGFCPDVPALKNNPVFMYFTDGFQKPNPFQPDVVVSIDDVIETKAKAIACLESQFYEGGANGGPELIPQNKEDELKRRKEVREMMLNRDRRLAQRDVEKLKLVELYGSERAAKIEFAESFEICEYGRRPNAEELRQLFPFFEER